MPALHPLVIWCVILAFMPEATMLIMRVLPRSGPHASHLGTMMMTLHIAGGLAAPLICSILSLLAMLQITNSRGTRKGYPLMMGTFILSLIHLSCCGYFSLILWFFKMPY